MQRIKNALEIGMYHYAIVSKVIYIGSCNGIYNSARHCIPGIKLVVS